MTLIVVLVAIVTYLVAGYGYVKSDMTRNAIARIYEEKEGDRKLYPLSFNEIWSPERTLKKVRAARREYAVLAILVAAVFPGYFLAQRLMKRAEEAPPVVDAEARDMVELMSRRIKELEKDTGVGDS